MYCASRTVKKKRTARGENKREREIERKGVVLSDNGIFYFIKNKD